MRHLRTDCILCNIEGKKLGDFKTYNRYTTEDPSGESYGIKRLYEILECPICQLVWVKDPDEDYDEMYRNLYWNSHMSYFRGWPEIQTEERINNDIKYANLRIPDIKKFIQSGNVLEVASSTGTTLKSLKDNGFGPRLDGVEVSLVAVKQGGEFSGCYIHPKALIGDEPEIPNNFYDFLIALDVFEHLEYPLEQAKIWVDKVKVGGTIFLEMPDSGCSNALVNPVAREKGIPDILLWNPHMIPFEHVFFYRQEHVKKIFSDLGCICLESTNVFTTDRMRLVFRRVF